MRRERRDPRSLAIGLVTAASALFTFSGVAAQSPGPSLFPTPFDPDAIVLRGRLVGSNEGIFRTLPRTDLATQVTMDVTLTIASDRFTVQGNAMVSGSYSGDCQFAHEEAVVIDHDSNPVEPRPVPETTSGRPAYVTVTVYLSDPRLFDWPITGFAMGAGAGTSEAGGSCGYLSGGARPLEVGSKLQIDVMGCDYIDVLALDDAYTGSCSETSGSEDQTTIEWTASFEQVYP